MGEEAVVMQRSIRFAVLSTVLIVLGLVIGPAGTQEVLAGPRASPCAPGAAYDPVCDVDHDGDVDIFDIQLSAGHWNQSGTWVSDNNHDHLGQTWTGTASLNLTGSFGYPDYAPLVLGNSHTTGDGLRVKPVTTNGVTLDSVGLNGVAVVTAGHNGVWVYSAGDHGLYVGSAGSNGVYVGSAGAHGVYALTTNSAYNGVYGLNSGGGNGVRGDSNGAITSGVYGENTGGGFGVAGRVINGGRAVYGEAGAGWAGWFNGSVTITGTCSGCRAASFAVNAGTGPLQPGDVVTVRGVFSAGFDNAPLLWEVLPAQASQAAVGVVAGRATPVTAANHLPSENGQQLLPGEGAAAPGEYVAIVYSGPAQVRLAPGERTVTAGTRLTAAAAGAVRPLGTLKVQLADGSGTADMLESAPVIGVALDTSRDGLVWMLVNPQ